MTEIGSEFWLSNTLDAVEDPIWDRWSGEKYTYLSGRTALSAILDDICSMTVKYSYKAYLPSYCCHTMIEPFIKHGMTVEFYSVIFENGKFNQGIDGSKSCDIVLVLDYFGFIQEHQTFSDGAIVIRDLTHVIFSTTPFFDDADYSFASFRKWGAIAGAAIAIKRNGSWLINEPKKQNTTFLSLRNAGYESKNKYLTDKLITDKSYLQTFKQAELLLESDYEHYAADYQSLKNAKYLNSFVTQRRKNARQLLFGLHSLHSIEALFSTVLDNETPLFVPVFVKNGKREKLRQYLIENKIYCPVHWPLSDLHRINSDERELYDAELSLICDQRYNKVDMEHQLSIIKRFESENA